MLINLRRRQMRALTMDEVESVSGGEMVELPICSDRTNTRPVGMWDMRWGDFGSYASDALLGWACGDDISDLEEVKVTAQKVGLEEISVISNTSPAHWWDGAFAVLGYTLETVSHFLPEPAKSYVEGLAKVPEIGKQTADTIWNRKNYDNYVIDEQSNGDEPFTFEQWRATRGGK